MNQFELFLNRMRGSNMPSVDMPTPQEPKQPDFKVPSQMPGAMGGGFDHGITGNLSDIQQMPYRYGDQGGIQQMPYRGGAIPGTDMGNVAGLQSIIKQDIPAVTLDGGKTYFDPRDGSPIDMDNLSSKDFYFDSSGRGIDFGKGLEALKKGKERGGVMNDSTYEALQMLQGY